MRGNDNTDLVVFCENTYIDGTVFRIQELQIETELWENYIGKDLNKNYLRLVNSQLRLLHF